MTKPLAIFVVLQNQSSINANLCPKIRTKVNYVLLQSILEQTNFHAMYNDDINYEYQNFVHNLKNAAIQSAESRASNRYGEPVCPWMASQILGVLKEKDSCYRKWKQNKRNKYYLRQFRRLRNVSVSLMRKRKREYYSSLIEQANGNTQNIWEIVNHAIGLRPNRDAQPELADQD